MALILSCEHGGNEIPGHWRARRRGPAELLESHRGFDIGALELAREMAATFQAPLEAATITRLLIDLNRDEDGHTLFTGEAFALDDEDRRRLVDSLWRPHRDRVRDLIEAALDRDNRATFLSLHSFTPVWDGLEREVDLGLLIDPERGCDRDLAEGLVADLAIRHPGLRVEINRPYSGLEEGIDRSMRQEFGDEPLRVLTLELNQRYPLGDSGLWKRLRGDIIAAVRANLVT